jgi:predicted ATPase/GAF domain-containing protein
MWLEHETLSRGFMQSLAPYTLTTLVHVGAHTVLHHGYRNADRAPVAVKLLKSEYPSPRDLARLRREYMITRDLDAAGIVKTYGLEKSGAGLALIMEDFGGRALNDILRARRLDLGTTLQIAVRLADALGTVHDHHIIHKDIKPHNILVNMETGQVKLTDFGIATRLSQEAQESGRPEALEGTLAYMSPEQTGRMNRPLDHRSDLYSLGVTLYEMLTDTLPFSAIEPMELVHSHIARTPPAPHERAPVVPPVLSDIVMKLLRKAAEDRYQSAYGLKADLEECLSRWVATGQIAPFVLGRKDASGELQIPQKLYGREAEIAALLAAFERAREGGALLALVRGPTGVGKSALVSEIRGAVGQRGGLFVAGKFDHFSRNTPYATIAAALRELVRHILSEPDEAIARWKREIGRAAFANWQLLIELIPEIAWLVGPQPAVPEVGPTEAQNRFDLVFQSFLGVFSTVERPLALFLDDLQWADPASLRLLSFMLTGPERRHLLVIGAYRPQEVGPEHALSITLDELRNNGAQINEITLAPLPLSSVAALLADTLGGDKVKIAPLARRVFEKTNGNPFFIGQFLKALHAEDRLSFDKESGSFRWDLSRIDEAVATDNVVDLLTSRIARLSPATQRLLMLAACIGPRFDLRTLSAIRRAPPGQVSAELWEARKRGLVLLQGAPSRSLSEAEAPPASSPPPLVSAAYRFSHDRVHQVAYSLIEEQQKQDVHLQIGRHLRAHQGERPSDASLFEIIAHLNLGAPLIRDRAERLELAQQNLAAGRKARASAAYRAALGYFDAGVKLLDEESWGDEYALNFALHQGLAECGYLEGDFDRAASLFDILLSRARSTVDRAHVYMLAVVLYTARNDYASALSYGRACVSLFGMVMPESIEAQKAAFDAEMARVQANLSGRRLEEVILAPMLTDPDQLALLQMLVKLSAAAYLSSPVLYNLMIVMRVNLCLQFGRSNMCGFVFGAYGFMLAATLGRYAEAREFWGLARATEEETASDELRSKTSFMIGCDTHFFEHLREALAAFRRAQRFAFESGDFVYLAYSCRAAARCLFEMGEGLSSVRDEIDRYIGFVQRSRDEQSMASLIISRQVIENLEGRTRDRASLSDGAFEELEFHSKLTASRFSVALSWYYFARLQILFLHGYHGDALEMAALAEASAASVPGHYFTTEIPFYAGLSLAALYPSAAAADKDRYAALLADHQAKIATFAELCPANYLHKHLLLGAEEARVLGRSAAARELYDEAIASARQEGFTHVEALANELAAEFYLSRSQDKLARLYLREALHGYLRWGATSKAHDLAEKYQSLLISSHEGPLSPASQLDLATTTSNDGGDHLDAAAITRAAQAIAGELVLEQLIDRLMRIVVENAGADRGVLLLVHEERLLIEAIMTIEPDIVRVGISAPLEAGAELSESVVQFVQRTTEPVVIGDATSGGPFAGDPYIVARRPKSILCLAMLHQGHLTGVLYLENKAARDVFTPARVELSGLLASQAAIAVENARMVAELRRHADALRHANRALADANAALGGANDALRDANAELERELVERAQAEAARAALKEELFRVQTPIIPITDRVLVMPLIGTIDADRARQVLETALSGVRANRAEIVILDITGVDMVDAGVTSSLVRTAQALRLLGAQAVITGVRPEVARALVELRLDLSAIVTQGTLESGIAYAMDRLGEKRSSPRR